MGLCPAGMLLNFNVVITCSFRVGSRVAPASTENKVANAAIIRSFFMASPFREHKSARSLQAKKAAWGPQTLEPEEVVCQLEPAVEPVGATLRATSLYERQTTSGLTPLWYPWLV